MVDYTIFYSSLPSIFGTFSIVWKDFESSVLIQRIFLSDPKTDSARKVHNSFKHQKIETSPLILELGKRIQRFFEGHEVQFDLELLDFSVCNEIQKKVLLAEYNIPRGWISTYKRIALHCGIPKGARIVGKSLATNPFPIVIPCHRAVRENRTLAGFQGGVEMKQYLLKMEGVQFSVSGRIITDKIHY